MGLITGLLTLPLAPVRGVMWLGDVLLQAAEQEVNDDESLRARLRQLDDDLAEGRISDDVYEQEWDEVVQRVLLRTRGGVSEEMWTWPTTE